MDMSAYLVAPFTGAWIEMDGGTSSSQAPGVAPFTGAWIEIERSLLKSFGFFVAPFTGAWIEIWSCAARRNQRRVSHPSRVRGLKLPGDG